MRHLLDAIVLAMALSALLAASTRASVAYVLGTVATGAGALLLFLGGAAMVCLVVFAVGRWRPHLRCFAYAIVGLAVTTAYLALPGNPEVVARRYMIATWTSDEIQRYGIIRLRAFVRTNEPALLGNAEFARGTSAERPAPGPSATNLSRLPSRITKVLVDDDGVRFVFRESGPLGEVGLLFADTNGVKAAGGDELEHRSQVYRNWFYYSRSLP